MRKATLILAAFSGASLVLAGCDVEKTQEGSVQVPQYEVTKKQEGDVTLPKYDVDAPKVDVSKTEKEVTVPKIVTEKETITVPKVDVSKAEDDDKNKQQQAQSR
jgi:hypothetical protein